MTTFFQTRNCTWLMVSLFTLLILFPMLRVQGMPGRLLMSGLWTFILLSSIRVVSGNRRHLAVGILLMVPPVLILWISHTLELDKTYLWLDPGLYNLPIYLFVSHLILQHIFKPGPVTSDQLHGAISLYLLIGVFWSNCYVILERFRPGSFRIPEDSIVDYADMVMEFMYFSYVTLTTLGYGDISPVTPLARSLSILEAMVGVLFMGALVARIAGNLGPKPEDST